MPPGLLIGVGMLVLAGLIWYIGYRMNYTDIPPDATSSDQGGKSSFVSGTQLI